MQTVDRYETHFTTMCGQDQDKGPVFAPGINKDFESHSAESYFFLNFSVLSIVVVFPVSFLS